MEVEMKFRGFSRSRGDCGARLAIILLLSFGLGSAALLYTALDRLLVNPLGVPHPETVVRAVEKHPPLLAWLWFPYNTYDGMRSMRSFESLAIDGEVDAVVTANGKTQPVVAEMVSGDYFSLLRSGAERGRALNRTDETGGAGAVAIVASHRFWMSEFAGSRSAIGSSLLIQGKSFPVFGVMPKQFVGTRLDTLPDIWLPLSAQPLLSKESLKDPQPSRQFSIVARLRNGVTIEQAQAEFSGVYRSILAAQSDASPDSEGLIQPIAQSAFALHDQFG
jgi:hypothetical protein